MHCCYLDPDSGCIFCVPSNWKGWRIAQVLLVTFRAFGPTGGTTNPKSLGSLGQVYTWPATTLAGLLLEDASWRKVGTFGWVHVPFLLVVLHHDRHSLHQDWQKLVGPIPASFACFARRCGKGTLPTRDTRSSIECYRPFGPNKNLLLPNEHESFWRHDTIWGSGPQFLVTFHLESESFFRIPHPIHHLGKL